MRRLPAIAIIVCVGAAIAAVTALWAFSSVRSRVGKDAADVSPRQQTFEDMRASGAGAVYVEDQTAGSDTVAVGFAVMQDPGYVEIRADDSGHPGEAIGRSERLPSGGGEHLVVALDRPLVDGQVYYALLLDQHANPLANAQGDLLLMSFVARADAAPETSAVEP